MEIKEGDWVLVGGHESPGRIKSIAGEMFFADFLVEDGSESWLDSFHVSEIEKVIRDQKEIEYLEKEYKGGK